MPYTSADVAACARGWLGTRFQHQGRLKKAHGHKGGVDCLGLLIGVADELGLEDKRGRVFATADERDYGHLPDVERLHACLCSVMDTVPGEDMREGDVLLMAVDGRAQHLGLVGGAAAGFTLIHAYAPARVVVEHALDSWWRARIKTVFRISSLIR